MKKQIITTLIIIFASNAHSQIMVEWAGQFKWGSGSGAHINKYWVPLAEKEVENGNKTLRGVRVYLTQVPRLSNQLMR